MSNTQLKKEAWLKLNEYDRAIDHFKKDDSEHAVLAVKALKEERKPHLQLYKIRLTGCTCKDPLERDRSWRGHETTCPEWVMVY